MPKIILILVITYVGGLLLSLTNGAHWAFYVYQIIYFFNPDSRWWSPLVPSFPYSKVSVIFLLGMFFLSYSQYKRNLFSKVPQFKWSVLLLISFGLVYFYAVNQSLQLTAAIDYLKMFITIAVAYKILDTQKKIEGAYLAYLIGVTYIGYEAYVVGRDDTGRVEGIGMIDAPDGNNTAASMVPAIPLLIFYVWLGSTKMRLASLLMGAFTANGLVLINSRGAFLGVVVSAGLFLMGMFFSKVKVKFQKLLVIVFLIVGSFGVVVLVDDTFLERMNTLSEIEDESKSGSSRYRFWIIAVEMSKEYPFGTGAYGYDLLSPIYVPPELFDKGKVTRAVHSIWFQALSEVGWHGLFFFLMILLNCFLMLRKIKQKAKAEGNVYQYYLAHAILCSYIGLLVSSSFINQFRVQIIYWMIIFTTSLYSVYVLNDDSPQKDKE